MDYPDGIDLTWLAIDGQGFVAAFTTGGCGPIPTSVVCQGDLAYDAFYQAFEYLPKVGDAQILVDSNGWRDTMWAEKGVYAYDWTDVHRVAAADIHAYELLVAPTHPIKAAQLPVGLTEILKDVHFPAVMFYESKRLRVGRHLPCTEGPMR